MSIIRAIRHQLGLSVTANNNFTWDASADNGSMRVYRGNAGTPIQDILTVSSTNVVTAGAGAVLAPSGPAFSYFQSVAQAGITAGTFTKITFTSPAFDTTGGMFAASRFTPTVAGYYNIIGGVSGSSGAANAHNITSVYKNGLTLQQGSLALSWAGISPAVSQSSALVFLNGTTDFVEIFCAGDVAGAAWTTLTGTSSTYFQGYLVRAA